jgi:predicted small secreted protein
VAPRSDRARAAVKRNAGSGMALAGCEMPDGQGMNPLSECNSSTNRKGTAMISKLMLLLVALSIGSIPLAGCNTIQGAGKDIEKGGQKVQEEAKEHKTY